MKSFPLLLSLCTLALLSGCALQRSTEWYRPTTLTTYPPKPKNAKIPILAAIPREPHIVIGQMNFWTTWGDKFVNDALVYNARRNGADAVVVLGSNSSTQYVPFTVPGYVEQRPVTTTTNLNTNYYGSRGYYGQAYGTATSTSYVPVVHPGYSGVRAQTRVDINAVMIRLTGKGTAQ